MHGSDKDDLQGETNPVEAMSPKNQPMSPVKTPKSPVQVSSLGATTDAATKENVPTATLSPPKMVKENESNTKPQESATTGESTRDTENAQEPKLFVVEEHHDTEVVIERLLDVKGLEQSVTGLWGWMSGSVTKVAEQATKVASKASEVAKEASQQASIVAEKASQQASIVAEKASKAKAVAEQQAKELAATVSKTMEDKAAAADAKPAPVIAASSLPWETAHPERRAEARERILKLSMDDHTFTVPPPKEAKYVYDAVAREPYAARLLDTDALLSAKRFKLVPKAVDEQEFWRNYFYRVDLVLSALGLPATPVKPVDEKGDKSESKAAAQAQGEAAHQRDLEEEMRQEIARVEASHLEDAVKDDENFDMLEDDLEFEDDAELEKSLNDLKL